jgi:dTDP-4-amino-4,6-dideoxy-D-galactose acyltransferase
MIEEKKWDSDFFNLKIGEVNFFDSKISSNYTDFDLLYVVSHEDFDLQIEGFNNSFSEQKVKFYKEIQSQDKLSNQVFSIKNSSYDIQDLYELAYESGKNSRFLLDPNFGNEKFKQLYQIWINNSVSNEFATDVMIYKEENKTVGLLTYKSNENEAFVGLIAVSNEHQGKGIGGILLRHLETILFNQGINSLTIPTQLENHSACSFYKKQGYSIAEIIHIKHFWKNNDTI